MPLLLTHTITMQEFIAIVRQLLSTASA